MVDPSLVELVRCPQERRPLQLAGGDLLSRLNEAIRAGQVTNVAGVRVETPLDGGLVRDDGVLLYPIFNEISVLMSDEAIQLDQISQD